MEINKEVLGKYNWIALVVVIVLGFNLMNLTFFSNSLQHASPQGYMASDAYWHAAYSQSLLKDGTLNKEPLFIDSNSIGLPLSEPPFILYLSSVSSWLFKIPYYDAAIFTVFLIIVAALFALYYISDKIDPVLPYFSLPAALMLFIFPFIAGISWGFWKMYFGALLWFIFISMLLWTELNIKSSILFGVLLAVMITTHPHAAVFFASSVALIYIYDIFKSKEKRTVKYFMNYAIIAAVGVLMSAYSLADILFTRLSGKGFLSEIVQTGYNIGSATPQISSLGFVWWLALLGVIASVFLTRQKEHLQKRQMFMMTAIFIFFLGPLIGFDRVYQTRLLWPLFIAIFAGMLVLIVLNTIKLPNKYKTLLTVLIFIAFALSIYLPHTEKLTAGQHSLTEDSYWEGIMYLSNLGGEYLIVDPILTQHSVVLNAYYPTRFTMQDDVISNLSIKNYSRVSCSNYTYSRKGIFNIQKNTAETSCDTAYDICNFNYILLHAYAPSDMHKNWLHEQIKVVTSLNTTVVWQKEATFILKNNGVCVK